MLETFTPATFTPHLGTIFHLHLPPTPGLDVELMTVTPWQSQAPGSPEAPRRRAPFALLFRGPMTPMLPQRIYPLEHVQLGAFELFLVPVGPDQHGMCYEAVFA
jgi:hypothetical protein